MKAVRGFIFTIDAVFSLIVASAAVGILVYAYFSQPLGYQVATAEAYSIAQSLSTTQLQQAALSSIYIAAAANASSGSAITWPYYGLGGQMDSSVGYGPRLPELLFSFTAANEITSSVSVADGMAVFSAGNAIYALNATTGRVIINKSLSSNPLYPIIFAHTIIYANASGYINAMSYNAAKLWNSTALPAVPDTPLTIENGYLALGAGNYVILANPLNGNIVATDNMNGPVQTPSYGHGEYLAVVPGDGVATYGYLYSLALYGGTLVPLWSYKLSNSKYAYTPAIGSNYIAVASGGSVTSLTLGGSTIWQYSTSSNGVLPHKIGSPAISGGDIYFMGKYSIYDINATTGNTIWHITGIGINNQNVTPSVTPYDVYVVTNQTLFRAYNIKNQSFDINVEFPEQSRVSYNQVALAYGNAYATDNNTLYAFGTCRDNGADSILSAIAKMYIDGDGGCANLILNTTYQTSRVGIFINGSYGPALHLATFNGKTSAIYSISSERVESNYSVSMWFDMNQGSPIVDLYNASSAGGIGSGQNFDYGGGWVGPYRGSPSYFSWGEDWPYNLQYCNTTAGSIKSNTWYNVVVSVSDYNSITIYINGTKSTSCSLSVTYQYIGKQAIGIGVNPTATFSLANGTIAGVQLYNGRLSPVQASTLYYEGIAGMPATGGNATLIGWWPLEGDGNSYAGSAFSNLGYPYNVTYKGVQFQPVSLLNAYQVSKSSLPLSLGTGSSLLYNVSVVVWR